METFKRYWAHANEYNLPQDLFQLHTFFLFCYFSNSLAFVTGWFLCPLMLIMICLFWTYIWNIQWSWSFYVCLLCGVLLYDSNPICKKCWLCLCKLSHACWWFGTPLVYELFLLAKDVFLSTHVLVYRSPECVLGHLSWLHKPLRDTARCDMYSYRS